jgi:hypothetical protein
MTETVHIWDNEEVDLYNDLYNNDEPPTGSKFWANYTVKKDGPSNTWDTYSSSSQARLLQEPMPLQPSSSSLGVASNPFDDGIVTKRYHNIAVYEYIVDSIACKRRVDNDYIQVDPLLDVAYLSDTKKQYVLEEEVLPHCPEAGRYATTGEFGGIWVPLKFARNLAWTLGIDILLQPLFDFSPSAAERNNDKENFEMKTNRVEKYHETVRHDNAVLFAPLDYVPLQTRNPEWPMYSSTVSTLSCLKFSPSNYFPP